MFSKCLVEGRIVEPPKKVGSKLIARVQYYTVVKGACHKFSFSRIAEISIPIEVTNEKLDVGTNLLIEHRSSENLAFSPTNPDRPEVEFTEGGTFIKIISDYVPMYRRPSRGHAFCKSDEGCGVEKWHCGGWTPSNGALEGIIREEAGRKNNFCLETSPTTNKPEARCLNERCRLYWYGCSEPDTWKDCKSRPFWRRWFRG